MQICNWIVENQLLIGFCQFVILSKYTSQNSIISERRVSGPLRFDSQKVGYLHADVGKKAMAFFCFLYSPEWGIKTSSVLVYGRKYCQNGILFWRLRKEKIGVKSFGKRGKMYLNIPFLGNSGVLFTFLGRNELKYAGFLFKDGYELAKI